MSRFSQQFPGFGTAILFSMIAFAQTCSGQVNFTNSGEVSAGSSISGTLTDAAGDSVGYDVSTEGALFFGWNGHAGSDLGGVQANYAQSTEVVDWLFTFTFDSPIEQLTLSQAPFLSDGANAGGNLFFFSDAASVEVDLGTQGLGPDGLSNLDSASTLNSGDVITTLLPTFNNEDDWSVSLSNLQSLTVLYQPLGDTGADIGSEWFTISEATVGPPVAAAIPEPSALLGLTSLLAATALRRRRTQ